MFPGDAKWTKIEKVKDGRVYMLDFVASSRQLFFWLQEPKTTSDEEWATKLNDYLANGPSQTSISQQQQGLMSMLQQSAPQNNRQAQQRQQVQMDQLQQIMQSIAPRNQNQTGATQQGAQQQAPQQQQQQQGGQGKSIHNHSFLFYR